MAGWDVPGLTYHLQVDEPNASALPPEARANIEARKWTTTFFNEFMEGQSRPYHDQLQTNIGNNKFTITVDLRHMANPKFQHLLDALKNSPTEILKIIQQAAIDVMVEKLLPTATATALSLMGDQGIQVQLIGFGERIQSIRHLAEADIAKLVCVPGIIVR